MRFKLTIVRALVLLLVAAILLGSGSYLQAQDADALVRVQDRQLRTKEERERVLTEMLNAAGEARNASDWIRAAGFLNRAGRLRQLGLHEPEAALSTFKDVQGMLQHSTESREYIDSLNGSAAAYFDLSKCDEVKTLTTDAFELSKRSNYIAGKAEALLLLSNCQLDNSLSQAVTTARESLELWQSLNDRQGMGLAYRAIGHYQLLQSNVVEATKNHEESLKIFRELDIVPEEAESLIYLGFVAYRQGAWDDCLSYLAQAQGLLDEQAEPFKMGQITVTIGETFLENGLPEVARQKFELATQYFNQAKDTRAVNVMIWNLGKVYYALGNYQQALTNQHQALAYFESIKRFSYVAFCNEYLGRTYSAMGNSEAALQHLQNAFLHYSKESMAMEAARTGALIGQQYLQQGKLQPAREQLNSALNTFEKLADHVNGSATLYALGKLELKEGNLQAAEEYLRRSINATENIRRVSTSQDLTAAFSAAVDDRYQSYVECLMRQHKAQPDKGFNVRAFEASEASRGRALVEMLRATGGNFAPGVDAAVMEREKLLRSSLRVKEDYKVTLLAGDYKQEDLTALDTEIAQLEKEHNQVVETIQSNYPAFKQITHPQSLNLRQIQEQVIADDNTLMLEFSLGENESYVWAVTRNSLRSYELPPLARIIEQTDRLYKLLKTPPDTNQTGEINAATRELTQTVLGPVASELNKQRLIVVAHRVLNFIPFQVLLDPKNNEPLIATYEVVNTPSASILAGLSEEGRNRGRGRVLAAFGSPVFESNYSVKANNGSIDIASLQTVDHDRWRQAVRDIDLRGEAFEPSGIQPLFFAGRELANLREVAGEQQSMIAVDFDASRDQLLKTDLTQYSILHFATHGFLDPDRPENSGLVLSTMTRDGKAQNGFVSLRDVYQLRAPVAVVVLSACQTGLGKDVRGEGLIGLTRGFMYAGASSVVASLWKVDDEATAELMKRFYQNMLKEGMTPATALREAQNSFRQHPIWSAPYYWAGFTLQGNYRQVVAPKQSYRNYVIAFSAGVLLVLLGIAVWYYRRRGSSSKL